MQVFLMRYMALVVDVKVVFYAQVPLFVVDRCNNSVIVRIKTTPERGRANRELVKLLAQALKIPQAYITIITGITTRHKKIRLVTSLTLEQVFCRLESAAHV